MLRVVFAENNRYDVFIDLILSISGVASKGPAKASKLLPGPMSPPHLRLAGHTPAVQNLPLPA